MTKALNDKSGGVSQVSSSSSLAFGLSLAGQLAFAVIVPILIGSILDSKLNAKPYFLLAGFVIAMVGFILIIQRAVIILNKDLATKEHDD